MEPDSLTIVRDALKTPNGIWAFGRGHLVNAVESLLDVLEALGFEGDALTRAAWAVRVGLKPRRESGEVTWSLHNAASTFVMYDDGSVWWGIGRRDTVDFAPGKHEAAWLAFQATLREAAK